ncbi:MAG: hypothetical protein LBU37_04150 [Tannerellaceae bacterium]|jgi:hypothetical protein|nr:hypothetical protein [Tannerellaceae bacterium]
MDTYFNLKRIGYLLRADWIEHKKSLLFCLGGVSFVWIASLYFIWSGRTEANFQKAFFFIGELVTFIYYCRFISKKIHQPKGLYYTLPASNQEKYFTLLFEGLLFFLAFAGIFRLGLFLFKLFSPGFSVVSLSGLYDGYDGISHAPIAILLCLSSIIFLSHITFRKFASLIGFTGIALYILLFAGVSWKVVSTLTNDTGVTFVNEAICFMRQLFTPVLLIVTIVVLYIGYLKLKEKEQR